MAKTLLAFLGSVLLFLFSSCKKEMDVPSYVFIPKINVSGDYSVSGSDSSKIYGAKVFLNNQLIGVYQTPVEIPVFATGDQIIKTIALVARNGSSQDRISYPYYQVSESNVFLSRDSTSNLIPTVNYFPSTVADYWFEDFSGPGISFDTTSESTANLVITTNPDEVYEPSGSGKFELDSETAYIKALTNKNFIYKTNTKVFVEINYKNNQPFFFDIIIHEITGQSFKIQFFMFNNTIDENGDLYWNKIYLELASTLINIPNMASYDICFEMQRDKSVSNPIVLIDNVKVITDN